MFQSYIDRKFTPDSEALIDKMNDIIVDYLGQDLTLTVRQLYYQLVAAAIIPNTERSYKRITSLVNDARLAGRMDWNAIEDRTRFFRRKNAWRSGGSILNAVAEQFHMDMWANQAHRVFVIVEKDALVGVLEKVCDELDLPLLAARGYPSGTVLRELALSDIIPCIRRGQAPVILHLGDHDPSGIDMSRDLTERIAMFSHVAERGLGLERIALNMDQIHEQDPPENPAKVTDSRFDEYSRRFGDSSWELDALRPEYLAELVRRETTQYIDPDNWEARQDEITDVKRKLSAVAASFDEE